MVCAKTGTTADGVVEERSESFSAAWLGLLLLGPLGILALAVIWRLRGRTGTHVEIPLSSASLDELRATARTALIAGVLGGLATVVFLIVLIGDLGVGIQIGFGAVAIVALVWWMFASTRARMARVRLRLDRTQTLLHLDGVHPDFVTAVQDNARALGLLDP